MKNNIEIEFEENNDDTKNIASDKDIIQLAKKIGCKSDKYIDCKIYIKAWYSRPEKVIFS